MVEAGGVGIFRPIENTKVIDESRSTKRSGSRNCAQLERIWNAARLDGMRNEKTEVVGVLDVHGSVLTFRFFSANVVRYGKDYVQ